MYKWPGLTKRLLEFCKMTDRRLWSHLHPLRQFPTMTPMINTKLEVGLWHSQLLTAAPGKACWCRRIIGYVPTGNWGFGTQPSHGQSCSKQSGDAAVSFPLSLGPTNNKNCVACAPNNPSPVQMERQVSWHGTLSRLGSFLSTIILTSCCRWSPGGFGLKIQQMISSIIVNTSFSTNKSVRKSTM